MKKRIYRRMPVNDFQPQTIAHSDLGGELVFAIDVAKVDMVAAVAAADGHVLHTICWKAPEQNLTVLSVLRGFRAAGITVETVMEPSGTYGDVLRHQLEQDAFPVFMVSGKRTHDAKEIFDGVPSLHDAKAAAIIARLHADGLSTRLRDEGPDRRQLRAALARAHWQSPPPRPLPRWPQSSATPPLPQSSPRSAMQGKVVPLHTRLSQSHGSQPQRKERRHRTGQSRVLTESRSVPVLLTCTAYERFIGMFDGADLGMLE